MSMKREWVVILGTAFSALSVGAADGTIDATRWPDRSRLTIGTYCLHPAGRTEANMKDMKACGIDFVLDDFADDPKSAQMLASLGIGVAASGRFPAYWGGDVKVNGNLAKIAPLERYEKALSVYRPTPVDVMVNIGDELSALDFPHVGRVVSRLAERGLRQTPYFNLHPAIHQDGNVVRYYGASNYVDYIAAYVRHVPLDYISFDIYPYQFRDRPEWGFARFFDNMRIVSDACRDSGRAFWYIPQANAQQPQDNVTANKMRYQAYAALAFGAEALTWACWMKGWWTNNILDENGVRGAQYDRLREVMDEIRRFDRDYMRFRRVQTHFTGFTGAAAKWIEPDPRTGIPRVNVNMPDCASTAFFGDIRADDGGPLLVGEFVPRDASSRARAIFLFAADDPWDAHPAARTIRFRTAYTVSAVGPDGAVRIDRAADGTCSLTLKSSRCALVTGLPPAR